MARCPSHPAILSWPAPHRALHSFPTRRSSDLADPIPRNRSAIRSLATSAPGIRTTPGSIQRPDPGLPYCVPRESVLSQRSEEHTSELQSHSDLVCRLLLEKKKMLSIPYRETRR